MSDRTNDDKEREAFEACCQKIYGTVPERKGISYQGMVWHDRFEIWLAARRGMIEAGEVEELVEALDDERVFTPWTIEDRLNAWVAFDSRGKEVARSYKQRRLNIAVNTVNLAAQLKARLEARDEGSS